jgi:uncharacterized protein YbbC (DUF1343 family)
MTKRSFSPGVTALLGVQRYLIEKRRVGLVSHPAAVNATGASSAELLSRTRGVRLAALFGPEHGFFGTAPAGEPVVQTTHPWLPIPVYSLYGTHSKPSPAMLKNLDIIVFDLQDLGVRSYTYVSTLRLVLEAACEMGKAVIVADRPVPLPDVVDGPILDPRFESFVGSIPAPMVYGMTPGEAALWLKKTLSMDVDLTVCKMKGYARDTTRGAGWPPWIPPSPGIVSWESGYCYAATVCFEALPAIDHGRGTGLPFQVFGAPWLESLKMCDELQALRLPGVVFHPHHYVARSGDFSGQAINAVRLTVTAPAIFRPVTTAVSIISCLQQSCGQKVIWRTAGTRPGFFDKLFGTDAVRNALMDREEPNVIAKRWKRENARFAKSREACLLYKSD